MVMMDLPQGRRASLCIRGPRQEGRRFVYEVSLRDDDTGAGPVFYRMDVSPNGDDNWRVEVEDLGTHTRPIVLRDLATLLHSAGQYRRWNRETVPLSTS